MSTLTGLIGGGGGGIDNALLPTFPENLAAANSSYVQAFPHGTDGNESYLPGHNSNGDYYRWDNRYGTTTAHKLSYYNNAGSLQWTINESDINFAADRILAVLKQGSTIYLLAATAGTANAWIATANESGTILTNQSVTLGSNVDESLDELIMSKPTGSSNVFLAIRGRWMAEINPSTGAIVNDSVSTDIRPGLNPSPSFITTDTRCLGISSGNDGFRFSFLLYSNSQTNTVAGAFQYFMPHSYFNFSSSTTADMIRFIEWGNFVVVVSLEDFNAIAYRYTSRALYNKADLETWAESFMDALGATLTAW